MGKIAGKVPELQEKMFDFPYFSLKFDQFFKSPYRLREKPLRRKNKAPQSQRTSIVIAIVFLKQRSVFIIK